jgi:hypothetical protein
VLCVRLESYSMITTNANLEQEYRLIRIDLANAVLDVNGSVDSLTATGADGVISQKYFLCRTGSRLITPINGGLDI